MDLPAAFAYVIIGLGSAAAVAWAAWSMVWFKRKRYGLSLLDFSFMLWWLAIVGIYLATVNPRLDLEVATPYTVRPMLITLALLSVVRSLAHYSLSAVSPEPPVKGEGTRVVEHDAS